MRLEILSMVVGLVVVFVAVFVAVAVTFDWLPWISN